MFIWSGQPIFIHPFQKVMLDLPPGGAWTLTDVPLTLLPKASYASATLAMLFYAGTAPLPADAAEAELAPPPATGIELLFFSSSSVPHGDYELTAAATPPAACYRCWFLLLLFWA